LKCFRKWWNYNCTPIRL